MPDADTTMVCDRCDRPLTRFTIGRLPVWRCLQCGPAPVPERYVALHRPAAKSFAPTTTEGTDR